MKEEKSERKSGQNYNNGSTINYDAGSAQMFPLLNLPDFPNDLDS